MPEVDPTQAKTQRRRSERVSQSLPLIVRGVDLLGQPFEERTTTLVLNLHGCRYSSRHHLPKNTWVTVGTAPGSDWHNVRARVAWIQRPHSVREFFQVAVEFETPTDLWGIDSPPADWTMAMSRSQSRAVEMDEAPTNFGTPTEGMADDMTNTSPESSSTPSFFAEETVPASENPLLHELVAELEREARGIAEKFAAQAAEKIRQASEDEEQKRTAAARDFLAGLRSEFEGGVAKAREIVEELDSKAQALRAEREAALEAANRIAQAEHTRTARHWTEPPLEDIAASAKWNERLELELTLAQSQWNELLQSSIDSGMQRLLEQLSDRTQDVLRVAEQRMSEKFLDLRQPLAEVSSQARETLTGMRSELENEMSSARSSLAEIEHALSRIREYSAQLEAASHDTLNELHRRLENILEAQTDEMQRRTEKLTNGLAERFGPTLDSLGRQLVERTITEVESKLAPHLERVPALLREISGREVQVEESLRLHRERLRQVSENNQREVSAQMAATVSVLHGDFETARREALKKWSEELDASGIRVSHAAADSIGQASEWFQQEARARLQVLVEQNLAATANSFEEKMSEASQRFAEELDQQSFRHIEQVQQQLDSAASEVAGRTRTQLGEAAEAAAASFGQVLRGISGQEVEHFTNVSHIALQERTQELERSAQEVMGNLAVSAEASLDRFRAQMASQLETSVAEGRGVLAAEFSSAFDRDRSEREAQQKEWSESLERISEQAAAKYQDRLETAHDSWMVSSVRRLNEHGQNVLESLMRSTDQALRDSCSRVFEGLAQTLRERASTAASASFIPGTGCESMENSGQQHQ